MRTALVLAMLMAAGCGKEPVPEEAIQAHFRIGLAAQQAPLASEDEVDLSPCRFPGTPHGNGHVKMTFGHGGRVEKVEVDDPVFANTHTGWCVADRFKQMAKLDPTKYAIGNPDATFQF